MDDHLTARQAGVVCILPRRAPAAGPKAYGSQYTGQGPRSPVKSYVRQLLTEMPGRLRPREVLRALLSGVSRKPGNGTPSGGLRRFSMKKIRKQTNQQTRTRMWHGEGE